LSLPKSGATTLKRIRNYFVAGLIVLVPVIITWQLLVWLFNIVDGLLGGLVTQVFGRPLPGLGLVITILVVLLVGLLAANIFGRRLIHYGEGVMRRVPIVRSVYVTMKQITDAFVRQEQAAFSKVCVVEYPRKGIYSLGFLTSPTPRELGETAKRKLVGVFIPTTPNPTSGFLLYLPEDDVSYLEMPVEAGLKLVISGGVVGPKDSPGVVAVSVATGKAALPTGGAGPEVPSAEGGGQS